MTRPRPHLFARSRFAKVCDRLIETVWDRGWDEKPSLDPDYLWTLASKGYSEEDEYSIRSSEDVEDFRLRLERLCASLREEAALNSLGHTMAYGQLRNAIRKRHALGRLWRERPKLASTPIAPPIIVLGQMRSGTTRVQRLFDADPKLAGTRFCDSHDPVPSRPDLRPLKARAALFMARRVNPWLDTFHPFGATQTDEEIGWLSAALSPAAFEAQWRIPSYVAFNEGHDQTPVYREFARMLRTDAATAENAEKPRVLKCQQFAEDAKALLDQFPDAKVVRCTRAQDEVHASSVSMVASQMAYQSERHMLADLEAEWARKIDHRERRLDQALESFSGPVAEIRFEDLNADSVAAMASVYKALDMPFDRSARDCMKAEIEEAGRSPHRMHREQIEHLLPETG